MWGHPNVWEQSMHCLNYGSLCKIRLLSIILWCMAFSLKAEKEPSPDLEMIKAVEWSRLQSCVSFEMIADANLSCVLWM